MRSLVRSLALVSAHISVEHKYYDQVNKDILRSLVHFDLNKAASTNRRSVHARAARTHASRRVAHERALFLCFVIFSPCFISAFAAVNSTLMLCPFFFFYLSSAAERVKLARIVHSIFSIHKDLHYIQGARASRMPALLTD